MIKTLSRLETLIFNALYSLPNYLQGLFTRRKIWVWFWAAVHVDRFAIRFVSRLRKKYGNEYFFTRVSNSKTVIVLAHQGIEYVLANSPRVYADSEAKRTGMSHFQPNALTISRGAEWRTRRTFNEAVLNSDRAVHEYADRFLNIVENATQAMSEAAGADLTWNHFDELFEQIASGVIFGTDPQTARPMFDRLVKMMRESNRLFALKESKHFEAFYADIWSHIQSPEDRSLVSLCSHTAASEATRMENQIPHWMFAIRETLAANTARALALILSHPAKEERVRDELIWSERLTPETIRNLRYLEGCIEEGMRLWPTTPFLAREVIVRDILAGDALSPGTQVLILNTFNHRDRETNAEAAVFCPEQWLDGRPDLPFNHFSSGTQVCAGRNLALFIAKAVLAKLLQKRRYVLRKPSINPRKPIPAMYNYFRISFREIR